MSLAAHFVTGALAFGFAQAVWSVGPAQGLLRGTWMLKTFPGIVACFVLFVAVGAVACARRGRGGVGDVVAALVAGSTLAMAIALFIVGPGNVWPIVIALDTMVIAVAVGAGAMLARFIGRRHRAPEA